MCVEQYKTAHRNAEKRFAADKAQGKSPYLPVLDEITADKNISGQQILGLVSIPVEYIVGTVNVNRSNAFSSNFMPLLDAGTEFYSKWINLYASVKKHGICDPIKVYEYLNKFYVQEGNKRVCMSKIFDMANLEANVIRIIPVRDGSEEIDNYYEFMEYYEISHLNDIYFTKVGSFPKFIEIVNGNNEPWDEKTRSDVRMLFYVFKKEYLSKSGDNPPISVSDAFFIFVSLLGYEKVKNLSGAEIKSYFPTIWKEFLLESADDPIEISSKPNEEKPSVLNPSVLKQGLLKAMFSANKELKIAFVHIGNIDNSTWVYAHELGKHYLEEVLEDSICCTSFFDVSIQSAENVLEEICNDGYDVIFSTSPQHNEACTKVALLFPDKKILSCSLNASTKHVRTYYLRTYESKYLLGLIAGAMTENNRIAYVADYPVYGSIASINAFALGAKTVNPYAEIYLSWTSVKDSNPDKTIEFEDCDIVSNLDWSSPKHITRKFGLYKNEDKPVNLAAPLWDWGKLYESIVKGIMNGAWDLDESGSGIHSVEYWWGLSSGAVDIVYSPKIPDLTVKLVDYFKGQISKEEYRPFYGKLHFQNKINIDAGDGMDLKKLISMNYLYENVHGYVPGISDVKDDTVELTKVQGVKDKR